LERVTVEDTHLKRPGKLAVILATSGNPYVSAGGQLIIKSF